MIKWVAYCTILHPPPYLPSPLRLPISSSLFGSTCQFMMVPFTYEMPCAVFCYWSTANTFSLAQSLALKVSHRQGKR
jgi:hypothetical protein